ncbi:hypothetical protein YM304_40910 [Ilumatobacter coccineus YM16-304]|uniref:Uncharacterized protein n=1 Tax=Ilumatobacter coccineus (strain NBRC 103263 / KCTC 29153 / YM16-304) TaxID=1313172 RepID=A0A6C7EHF3_ILUCY|nr:hypothetical protein YM304_40910 [Ilumatobacter coccineus YM16-304]
MKEEEWERILWAADELGVGIVTFSRSHVWGDYTTHLRAKAAPARSIIRRAFLDDAGLPTDLCRQR